MAKSNLDDLITRLERTDGPDRDLDRAIGIVVLGWRPVKSNGIGMLHIPGEGEFLDQPGGLYPSLTESLEEAMALPPNGFQRLVRDHDGSVDHSNKGGGKLAFASMSDNDHAGPIYHAYGANHAIAYCAAALKAMAASS